MTTRKKKIVIPEGYKLIFRRYREDKKTGTVLEAAKYGIKAWPILVEKNAEVSS